MAAQMFNWNKALAVGASYGAITKALDKVVRRYSVEAAEKAKPLCPFKTGTLRASLTAAVIFDKRSYSPVTGKQLRPMAYLVGSALPYAAKQEYTHRTKSHFVHKGISQIRKPMEAAIIGVYNATLAGAWAKGG